MPADPSSSSSSPSPNGGGGQPIIAPITRLSLHSYHHHGMLCLSAFSKASAHAIGGIGFRFGSGGGEGEGEGGKESQKQQPDGCTHHAGAPTFHTPLSSGQPGWRSLDMSSHPGGGPAAVRITRVDVSYVPRSHRIAGLAFWDEFAGKQTERLAWRQWEYCGDDGGRGERRPEGLVTVRQEPPRDGARWEFVGVTGEWDESVWGSVLARVGAVWRRVDEGEGLEF